MKVNKAFSPSCLPFKMPLNSSVLYYLVCCRVAAEWLWTLYILWAVAVWATWAIYFICQKYEDPLNKKE